MQCAYGGAGNEAHSRGLAVALGLLLGKMLRFDAGGNPLLSLSALGLFNLVRSRPFVSVRINRVASLMLLVYLVHENLIVRQLLIPKSFTTAASPPN